METFENEAPDSFVPLLRGDRVGVRRARGDSRDWTRALLFIIENRISREVRTDGLCSTEPGRMCARH